MKAANKISKSVEELNDSQNTCKHGFQNAASYRCTNYHSKNYQIKDEKKVNCLWSFCKGN